MDTTTKVLVILSFEKPIYGLSVLTEPRKNYLARRRFVTAILTPETVTLYHGNEMDSYALDTAKKYEGKEEKWISQEKLDRLARGTAREKLTEAQILSQHLLGRGKPEHEHTIVCDLQLNPMDFEEIPALVRMKYPLEGEPEPYPTLLEKYSQYTEEEYQQWLKTNPTSPQIQQ